MLGLPRMVRFREVVAFALLLLGAEAAWADNDGKITPAQRNAALATFVASLAASVFLGSGGLWIAVGPGWPRWRRRLLALGTCAGAAALGFVLLVPANTDLQAWLRRIEGTTEEVVLQVLAALLIAGGVVAFLVHHYWLGAPASAETRRLWGVALAALGVFLGLGAVLWALCDER